jgi:spermidine synthase
VVTNPEVPVEIDDTRPFLNTTREKFDAITSDPFDPWVKGAATLNRVILAGTCDVRALSGRNRGG